MGDASEEWAKRQKSVTDIKLHSLGLSGYPVRCRFLYNKHLSVIPNARIFSLRLGFVFMAQWFSLVVALFTT